MVLSVLKLNMHKATGWVGSSLTWLL